MNFQTVEPCVLTSRRNDDSCSSTVMIRANNYIGQQGPRFYMKVIIATYVDDDKARGDANNSHATQCDNTRGR